MTSTERDPPTPNPLGAAPFIEDPSYPKDIQYIAERINNRQCILFLGSAIHAPAPDGSKYDYPISKCPPIGSQLSRQLATQCDYPGEDWWNLQRVAWFYERKNVFRSMLVDEIKEAVHNDRCPSPVLRGLARIGFPIVITTNYDQLYEQALDQIAREKALATGKSPEEAKGVSASYDKCVYSQSSNVRTKDCMVQPSVERPYLLKIHGDVDQPESIVVTDEDYIQFVLRMGDKHPYHPVGKNVLTHLIKWPTLFIGYRLSDYNLRLLFKTLRWKMDAAQIPPTYAVDRDPDVLIRDVWEKERRYIRFIEKNLWHFVPDLYQAVKGEEMPL
jgi:SIR2-like domain